MNSKNVLIKIKFLGFVFLLFSGFDYSNHSIPLDDIHNGGPAKDDIPAITQPKFLAVTETDIGFLKNNDMVIGFSSDGEARAYPVKILNWHEIVNDRVGEHSIVVTFCPLCGTGMIFEATVMDRKLTFGVSGLLYQSDMLLYDHQTESLWSQIKSEAVTGSFTGTKLKLLPSTQTTWGNWKIKYPNTRVLSSQTGYNRNYDRNPYAGYEKSRRLLFDVKNISKNFHPKEKIIGVELDNKFKAYPFSELEKAGGLVKDTVKGVPITVVYDNLSKTAVIRDKKGAVIPSVTGFWFAWYTFHPDTQIFSADKD